MFIIRKIPSDATGLPMHSAFWIESIRMHHDYEAYCYCTNYYRDTHGKNIYICIGNLPWESAHNNKFCIHHTKFGVMQLY